MKALHIVSSTLSILISTPIWFYLQYKILEAVNASELMWFLFWIYVPVLTVVLICKLLIDDNTKKGTP